MPPAPRAAVDRCKTGSGMQQPRGAPGPQLTAQQMAYFLQHQQQLAFQRNNQFMNTNRPTVRQVRDRYAGVLSEKEIEEAMEAHEDSGKTFRKFLLFGVLFVVVLLGYLKWDIEEGLELPPELLAIANRDAEIRGDAATTATTADGKTVRVIQDENAAQMEEYYKLLNVDGRIQDQIEMPEIPAATATDDTSKESAEAVRKARLAADRERRRGNFKVREALKQSMEKHNEQYGQLVTCGRTCEAEHKQLQLAYDTLNSKVDRELVGTLLDENVAMTGRITIDADTLKQAYEKKAEAIKSDETIDDEIKTMELAEIKDAYDILLDRDARTYYRLTGRKPPTVMKHISQRYGGWGQDLLLRTHKNRLILSWLDYLDGAWADYGVLCVIGFVGFLLPALVQLPRILEMAKEIEERQYQMEQMEKHVAAGGLASEALAQAPQEQFVTAP